MFKYLIAFIVVGFMAGCSGPNSDELKGFAEGCSAMAHNLLEPAGYSINDAKLQEFCKKLAQDSLNKKK